MKFNLEQYHRNVPDENLLQDVKDIAVKIGRETVTMAEYEQHGKYHPSTLTRRFGSWFNVLKKAGLKESRSKLNVPDEDLFNDVKDVWIKLGRQPKYSEFKKPLSKYSAGTYENRFGSWRKALEAFIEYINDYSNEQEEREPNDTLGGSFDKKESLRVKRRTKRDVSERLRFSILVRDGFSCKSCGRSPIKEPGVELHVDHIIPWSQGGETIKENLQTKCRQCNLGKGNAFDK